MGGVWRRRSTIPRCSSPTPRESHRVAGARTAARGGMSSGARGRRGEGGKGGEGGDSGDAGTNAEPEPNPRGRGPREGVAGGRGGGHVDRHDRGPEARRAAGESRAPDDAAGESPRAVTDALRDGPHAGLRVARGLSRGRGDVTSGFARRCAEVRALRSEKRGLGGPRYACRAWSGPATRGWTGVEAVWLLDFPSASWSASAGWVELSAPPPPRWRP
jgi:hypothetical protein